MNELTPAASIQAFMERDMSAQVGWLAQQATAHGYADLDDLFGRAPAVYTSLAVTWRQAHPLPGAGIGVAA
jgi:hypothetical protein